MALLASGLFLLANCTTGGDSVSEPRNNIGTVPWALTLNYKAITMLTSEPLQLHVTATTSAGVPLTNLPQVQWTTSDTLLKVDATGKITAIRAVKGVLVYARIVDPVGGWTIADTATVTTSDTVYRFSGYRLRPQSDTIIPIAVANNFSAVLLDSAGQPVMVGGAMISPNAVYSTDASRQNFQVYTSPNPRATAYNIGRFKVRASSYLFGSTYSDSVTFTLTYPTTVSLYIQRVISSTAAPSPSAMSMTDITITKGGVVNFLNQNTSLPADIVFDDTVNVVGGNIPVVKTVSPGSTVTFPNVGKFTYRSSLGFKGAITVAAPPTS